MTFSVAILGLMSGLVSGFIVRDQLSFLWLPGMLFAHAIIAGSFGRSENAGRALLRMMLLTGASVFAYAQALTQAVSTAPVLALVLVAAIVFAALGLIQLWRREIWGGVIALVIVQAVSNRRLDRA